MKKINFIKYALDLLMGLTFVLLFDPHASGLTVHEIAGLFMGGAYLTHILLNWRWVKNVTVQMFNSRLKWKVRLSYVLNVLLLIFMTITVASGILISRIVLPEFNREDIPWFRIAHLTLPFILLMLIGMHIGLHWNWVVSMTKRLLNLQKSHGWSRMAARLMVVLLLVYGSYAAYTYQFLDRIQASVAVVGITYEGELRGELMGKAGDSGKEGFDASAYGHGENGGHENGPHGSKGMDEGKGPPVNGIDGEEESKDGIVNGIGSEEADQHEDKGAPEGGLGGLLKAISLFFGLLSVFVILTYYTDKRLTRPKQQPPEAFAGINDLPVPGAGSKGDILLLWASQTGNAERVAAACVHALGRAGYRVLLSGMQDFALAELPGHSRVLIVASTFGEGEPPDNAVSFWQALSAPDARRLDGVNFAVLALGDSNYVRFCEFGRQLDSRFEQLGANRLLQRIDCDADYGERATNWIQTVVHRLDGSNEIPGTIQIGHEAVQIKADHVAAGKELPGYARNRPVPAKLMVNRRLNGEHSEKDTRHYEFDLSASGLQYEPGNALGVWPTNDPELVKQLIAAAGLSGDEQVTVINAGTMALYDALLRHLEITKLTPDLVRFVQTRTNDRTLGRLLLDDNRAELNAWMNDRQLIDLLIEYPIAVDAEQLTGVLKPLQPRLYSISSSPKAHPAAVHITVSTVRFQRNGETRRGACSVFLAERVKINEEVPVFIHKSPHFRLPDNPNTPIIMVGAGTGVAPFRAFLQERQAVRAKGKNWLIFGEQRAECDFYYKDEWEALRQAGFLHRLDLAFSRDQAEKIYVQHRMREAGAELWSWLEQGAYFYVCGDAAKMAKEVNDALKDIVRQHGEMSAEQSEAYVLEMVRQKRYRRDVY